MSGNEVNTFYNSARLSIQPTPNPITLTKEDTVYIEITVDGLSTEYVTGYLGKKVYSIGPETITVGMEEVLSNQIDFEHVGMKIIVENELGLESDFLINTLHTKNTISSQQKNAILNSNSMVIPAAKVGSKTIIEIPILNGTEIYAIHPDEITFDLAINLNPKGNNPSYSNFAYSENEFKTV